MGRPTISFYHEVVGELKLQLEKGTKFGVMIGDGSMLEGIGICKRVKVKLSTLTIVADFLAIGLEKLMLCWECSGSALPDSWVCIGLR